MTTRTRLYPYKQGSKSAAALAEAMGGRVLKIIGSGFTPRAGDRIINWGSSTCPLPNVLNKPSAVALASNKLKAFIALEAAGVAVPPFVANWENAPWQGLTVARTKLSGHSGEGIVLFTAGTDPVPDAPLYVKYVKKQDEYRVHVVGQSIIAVQRKARRLETPDDQVNWQVRNHSNGFVFVRDGVVAPPSVGEAGIAAVGALGLDFGAVDIIWNAHEQRALVLEVNTACGLEGQTVTDYAQALSQFGAN